MGKRVVCAVMVNDEGDILPYTCGFSKERCAEICQDIYGVEGWDRLKRLGSKIVQATLTVEE